MTSICLITGDDQLMKVEGSVCRHLHCKVTVLQLTVSINILWGDI